MYSHAHGQNSIKTFPFGKSSGQIRCISKELKCSNLTYAFEVSNLKYRNTLMLTEERDKAHVTLQNQDNYFVLAFKRIMLRVVKDNFCFLLCDYNVIALADGDIIDWLNTKKIRLLFIYF